MEVQANKRTARPLQAQSAPCIRSRTIRITDQELDGVVAKRYLFARGDKKAESEAIEAALADL